jgi:hypothetical protein
LSKVPTTIQSGEGSSASTHRTTTTVHHLTVTAESGKLLSLKIVRYNTVQIQIRYRYWYDGPKNCTVRKIPNFDRLRRFSSNLHEFFYTNHVFFMFLKRSSRCVLAIGVLTILKSLSQVGFFKKIAVGRSDFPNFDQPFFFYLNKRGKVFSIELWPIFGFLKIKKKVKAKKYADLYNTSTGLRFLQ